VSHWCWLSFSCTRTLAGNRTQRGHLRGVWHGVQPGVEEPRTAWSGSAKAKVFSLLLLYTRLLRLWQELLCSPLHQFTGLSGSMAGAGFICRLTGT
jgi:hypothetical protein